MKVLQICAAYKPAYIYGGPTMSVSMLSEQLQIAGVDIEVYATTANGLTELPVEANTPTTVDGVKVVYFNRLTKDHTHFSPRLLMSLWRNAKNFNVVHIHAWWNLVSLFTCLIALYKKVPVIVSPRGTLSSYSFNNRNASIKGLLHKFLGKPMLNKCHIHTTSTREKLAVEALIQPLNVTVLFNFVKLPQTITIIQNTETAVFKIIFLSRIEEKKGLELLIDALKHLTVPYHLTIAGTGDPAYVETLKTMSHTIADKITWAGFKTEDKFQLLAAHDLFVLPSYDENFGNAVIESLSVGTAVLISKNVGLADYVENNNLGWICDNDGVSITNQLNTIIKSKREELTHIRQIAPQIINADFDNSKLVNKYISMYQRIINK